MQKNTAILNLMQRVLGSRVDKKQKGRYFVVRVNESEVSIEEVISGDTVPRGRVKFTSNSQS